MARKTTTTAQTAPASVVFQFAAARQRFSRSKASADTSIAFRNGWAAYYDGEEPENERPPELPIAVDNKAAIALCLRWEINDELKRIQERVRPNDPYAAHRLLILKSIIADALGFLEPERDDDDMLLARRLYESAERGREVRNEFTDVRKRRQAVRNG